MNCASCGGELQAGAGFCGQCGAKVDNGVLRVTVDDLDEPAYMAPTGPVAWSTPPAGTPAIATPAYGYAYPSVPTRSRAGLVGAIIGAAGAALVVIGSLLSWIPDVPNGVKTPNAFRLPYELLIDFKTYDHTDSGVGVLLVALAVVGVALSFVPKAGLIRNLCGVGVLVVVILYLVQSQARVDDLSGFGSNTNLGDFLGPGWYVTGMGGLLMAAGPPRW